MEKRRKKRKQLDDSKSLNKVKKSSSEVSFDTFFNRCVFEGKLKSWQRLEIATFFKDNKLREKEDLEVFTEMLKKY